MEVALLEVGERAVCGLSGSVRGDRLRIRRAFLDGLPRPFEQIPSEERGRVLWEVLSRNGFEEKRVTLVVPRRYVLFRDLAVPKAPAQDLGPMVRFQLEKELPVPVDRIRFTWLELGEAQGKLHVVSASVPADVLEPVLSALSSIGIRVTSAVPATFGMLELLPVEEAPVAAASVFDGSVELLVWKRGEALFSRSAPAPHGAEIETARRLLASYLERHDAGRPAKMLVPPSLAALEEPGIAVEVLDPKSRIADERAPPEEILTLTGTALAAARRSAWLRDLLAPGEGRPRSRVVTAVRIAALVAAILVLIPVWLRLGASEARRDAQKMRDEAKKIRPPQKVLQELEEAEALVRRWADGRPRWIDVLADLSDRVDTKEAYLVSIAMESKTGTATIIGRSRTRADASELTRRIQASPWFDGASLVAFQELEEARRPEEFPIRFTIIAELKP